MKKINRILIANRGEIALRVIRSAREGGIKTIAVYADQDRDSAFVVSADEAYALRGLSAKETYLAGDKILEIAEKSGADAIHPGYGFLSENADFAELVLASGLIWIGPPPSAIRSLGDKISAREIAKRVNAPLAPGTSQPIQSASDAVKFGEKHGYPIVIKAAHGGGGRGLRVARTAAETTAQYESAGREALAAFGSAECFVEKYLDIALNVETLCLADSNG